MNPAELKLVISAKEFATSVMGKVAAAVEQVNSKTKSLQKEGLKFVNEGFAQMGEMAKVAAVGVGIAAVALIGYGAKVAISYEQQLSAISSLTGASKDQMGQISSLAMDLGAKTKFSALEAAQGAEELLKAGVNLTQVMAGGLAGALDLAAAGGVSVAEAAELASTALNAFKKDNLSVSQAADILAGASNASATNINELRFALQMSSAVAAGVGLSFKDTSTALATFAQNGLKGSDAGTSLKTMLLNLQPVTKAQRGLFNDLGLSNYNTAQAFKFLSEKGFKPAGNDISSVNRALIQYTRTQTTAKMDSKAFGKELEEQQYKVGLISNAFFTAEGKVKDLASISGILKEKLGGLTDQQRLLALETMFGTDAIRAANILFKEGSEGIKEMAGEMSKFTAADVAKEKTNNLAGAFERLKGSFDTKMIQVFSEPLPRLAGLMDQLGNKIDSLDLVGLTNGFVGAIESAVKFSKWVQDNKDMIIMALVIITGAFTGLAIATAYFNLITAAAAVQGITFAAALSAGLVPALSAVATAAWVAMASFLPFILIGAALALAIYLLVKNWDFLVVKFGEGSIMLQALLASLGAKFIEWVESVKIWLNEVVTVISTILNNISGIIHYYLSMYTNLWSMIWQSIVALTAAVFLTLVGLFTGNGELINQAWAGFGNTLGQIWSGVTSFIVNTANLLWASLVGAATAAGNHLINVTKAKWDFIVGIFNFGVSSVIRIAQSLPGVLGGIWENIVNSTKNSGNQIGDSTKNTGNRIKDGIMDGINFIKNIDYGAVGRNIMDGMANGVKNAAGRLVDSVKGAANDAIQEAKNVLGIKSPSRVFMEIGKNTVQGFVKGVDEEKPTVKESTKDMAGSATDEFNRDGSKPKPKPEGGSGGNNYYSIHITGGNTDEIVDKVIRYITKNNRDTSLGMNNAYT